jgi:hypothetical protein
MVGFLQPIAGTFDKRPSATNVIPRGEIPNSEVGTNSSEEKKTM